MKGFLDAIITNTVIPSVAKSLIRGCRIKPKPYFSTVGALAAIRRCIALSKDLYFGSILNYVF